MKIATVFFQDDDTLLHSAARGGNPNILQLLLERTKIDPKKLNKVLMISTIWFNFVHVVYTSTTYLINV